MTLRFVTSLLALLVAFCLTPAVLAGGAPVITGLDGNHAPTDGGSLLTINGQNLDDGLGLVTVLIGGGAAPIESVSDEAIVATVPAGQGAGLEVRVFVGPQVVVSPEPFSYAPPAINDLLPRLAPVGEEVFFTLVGDNFGVSPQVTAAGEPVTLVTANHDVLGFYRPEGLEIGTYSIVVDAGGQTASTPFEVTSAEPVSVGAVFPSVLPTFGAAEVDVFGAGFASDAQAFFDGAPVSTIYLGPERLRVIAPAGVGENLPVRVDSRGASSTLSGAYSYQRPAIQGISEKVPGELEVTGTGFGAAPAVTLDGQSAPVLEQIGETLIVGVPSGVGGRAGVVVIAGGQSSDVAYVDLVPVVCADLTGDGVVDAADLAVLIAGWGVCP